MSTIELTTPQDSSIEEQYTQGPSPEVIDMKIPGQQQNYEEWKAQMAPQVERMSLELPDLRIVSEYNRLMVEGKELSNRQMEAMVMSGEVSVHALSDSPLKNELMVRIAKAGVMAGNMPINDEKGQMLIKGLIGVELFLTQQNYLDLLTNKKMHTEQVVETELQRQHDLKTESLKLLEEALQYTGDNAGQVKAFTTGQDIEAAEPIVIDAAANPEKRIAFQVPDGGSRTGSREVSLLPGMYVARCGDNTIWGLTADEHKTVVTTK